MKAKAIFFLTAWLIAVTLPSALLVRQDKNGHIVLTNTIDRSVLKKPAAALKPSFYSVTIPTQYKAKIQSLSKKYQLREDLVIAVARAESSFNPFAVSPKGAVGLMQLMKGTALQYGVFNRYDADENLEAGVKHLKYLFQKYQENIPLTLAAYNAGEESVSKYNGIPPYSETRQYIRRVMSFMGMDGGFSTLAKTKTKIYKVTTRSGKTIITDTMPAELTEKIEILN